LYLVSRILNVQELKALTSTMGKKLWELAENNFPTRIGYIPNGSKTYSCSLERLLLASGVALTDAETGNAINAWYAVIRLTKYENEDECLKVLQE
jgi:hypothetical protein